MTRLAAVIAAAMVLAGCASPPVADTGPAHSRAPTNYESSISSYFDLTGAPAQRKLAFGAPETSPCVLLGSGGRHLGWVVPVIYDTSPGNAASAAAAAKGRASGASSANARPTSSSPPRPDGTVAMEEISISGTRYFFWFSSDTIAGVTRRGDLCP